ncbi:MAG: hypothetical protein U0L52_07305 [Bacteroidaceae bacterium]|nr:hypothetical protein [Bacteroidaceae bacterium]
MRKYLLFILLAFHVIVFANNSKDTLFVVESFAFEAKDGLKMEGALTLPKNLTEQT